MQHQYHFGKKFYIDKKTGYWISTCCPKVRAHVWVWRKTNGSIPKTHHVHHKDGNKSNNNINNLECLHRSDHFKVHLTEERRQWSRKWAEVIRPLTKVWHRSEEGRKWHREHGKKVWAKRSAFKINCLFCLKEIETKTFHHKFCNQNCKAKHGRRVKKDKESQTT